MGNPVKKPTRWLSNSKRILEELNVKCQGRDGWCWQGGEWKRHTPCYGRVATAAAIYPFRLCKAILTGLAKEMQDRGRMDTAARLVLPPTHVEGRDLIIEVVEAHDNGKLYAGIIGGPCDITVDLLNGNGQTIERRESSKAARYITLSKKLGQKWGEVKRIKTYDAHPGDLLRDIIAKHAGEKEELTEDELEDLKRMTMVMYVSKAGAPVFLDATSTRD